jgi:hypothetical protein
MAASAPSREKGHPAEVKRNIFAVFQDAHTLEDRCSKRLLILVLKVAFDLHHRQSRFVGVVEELPSSVAWRAAIAQSLP